MPARIPIQSGSVLVTCLLTLTTVTLLVLSQVNLSQWQIRISQHDRDNVVLTSRLHNTFSYAERQLGYAASSQRRFFAPQAAPLDPYDLSWLHDAARGPTPNDYYIIEQLPCVAAAIAPLRCDDDGGVQAAARYRLTVHSRTEKGQFLMAQSVYVLFRGTFEPGRAADAAPRVRIPPAASTPETPYSRQVNRPLPRLRRISWYLL
jgi:hypothetical protein